MNTEDENIVVSPFARDLVEIPKIPLMDYVFKNLRAKMPTLRDKIWLEDVQDSEAIKFEDVEELVKRYASAITKLGFKKGDLLFYCTNNINHLYLLRFAVWLLGGITKGSPIKESKEFYMKHLKQPTPKIILIDENTHNDIQDAMLEINLSVPLLCFGNVNNTISVKSLLNDDGLGIPDKIDIDPENDIFCYVFTSGSTGPPKIIPHTSYSFVAMLQHYPAGIQGNKILVYGSNNGLASIFPSLQTLMNGKTLLRAVNFNQNLLINWINEYKPNTILLYAVLANWFANTIKNKDLNFDFLKTIIVGASVLEKATVKILKNAFPLAKILQGYGMSEFVTVASTSFNQEKYPRFIKMAGETFSSSGKVAPYVQIKILDPKSGRSLERYKIGEIYIRSPQRFIGYCSQDTAVVHKDCFDTNGWFKSNDIGFYDDEFNIYVVSRWLFLFKFNSNIIEPFQVESLLMKHVDVLTCAVLQSSNNVNRVYVTLRPGKQSIAVTKEDLIDYVGKNIKLLNTAIKAMKENKKNQ